PDISILPNYRTSLLCLDRRFTYCSDNALAKPVDVDAKILRKVRDASDWLEKWLLRRPGR
ncbi:MAG: hypothetical protein ABI478_05385, partial [Propionivibrio sp.]